MSRNNRYHPGISYHKLPVGGNLAGLLFVVGCSLVSLVAFAPMRSFLALSLLLGAAIALFLHFRRPLEPVSITKNAK
jgi:hypothetical protein